MIKKAVLFFGFIFTFATGCTAMAANSDNFHTFVNFGISGLFLNMPKFSVGTKDYSGAPLVTFSSNQLLPTYHFGIGYKFCDDKYALIFRFNFLNSAKTEHQNSLGNGRVWLIDGSGTLFPGFIASDMQKTKISGKYHRDDLGIYFQGRTLFANSRISQNPYLGFVYNHLTTRDNYQVIYDAGFFADTDIENYHTQTNYYGLAVGDRLNYQINNRFAPFINITAELLHADSHLSANQNPAVQMNTQGSPPPMLQPKNISANNNQNITYRAILALGVNYNLWHFYARNIVATVTAGLDFWGYTPKIVTCKNETDSAVHLKGVAKADSFISLGITVPVF